ncbi:activator of basal transcription 1 [Brachyistius frenatus]|uniref:activator of basal transcription 1 n=1 Tax=Brachyistius frenatus TaxID=100188 RepID=UPI0037E88FAA
MERREEEEETIAQREEEEEEEEEDDEDEEEEEEEEEEEDDDVDEEQSNINKDAAGLTAKKKKTASGPDRKCVPGIVYLGHIPPRLRPKHLRNLLSLHGEIGRIFLQPEDRQVTKRRRKAGSRRCDFTEGWAEFRDKRVAKRVVASLHNTPMGSKKRQRFSSDLWCIKYLHRFQWTHLSERLAYEQTVLQQRLRTEVSQAKKETNFYLNNVEKSARLDKLRRKKRTDGGQVEDKTWDFTQRPTEEEIQMKKKKKKKDSVSRDKSRLLQQSSQSNVSLLAKIFNSNQP